MHSTTASTTARNRPWLLLIGTSISAGALACARELLFDSSQLRFLLWNLILAWVPLLLALWIRAESKSRACPAVQFPLGCLWLLFLPNAPYMLTDFVHLKAEQSAPLPFDVVILCLFSATGLVLWFLSLFIVQSVVRDRFGERSGWSLVGISIGLTGIGLYLGRFLRWNSWDLIVSPGRRIEQLTPHPALEGIFHALAFSVAGAALLALGYTAFYMAVPASEHNQTQRLPR